MWRQRRLKLPQRPAGQEVRKFLMQTKRPARRCRRGSPSLPVSPRARRACRCRRGSPSLPVSPRLAEPARRGGPASLAGRRGHDERSRHNGSMTARSTRLDRRGGCAVFRARGRRQALNSRWSLTVALRFSRSLRCARRTDHPGRRARGPQDRSMSLQPSRLWRVDAREGRCARAGPAWRATAGDGRPARSQARSRPWPRSACGHVRVGRLGGSRARISRRRPASWPVRSGAER